MAADRGRVEAPDERLGVDVLRGSLSLGQVCNALYSQQFEIVFQCIQMGDLVVWEPCPIPRFPQNFKYCILANSEVFSDAIDCPLSLCTVGIA